jgi:hypothetical protein
VFVVAAVTTYPWEPKDEALELNPEPATCVTIAWYVSVAPGSLKPHKV